MKSCGWQKYGAIRAGIAAVLAGLLLAGCADLSDDTQLAEERYRDALPTQEFKNVEMVHTTDGRKQFLLRAPFLDQYGNQKRAELYGGITIDFFKDGEVSSHLVADSGVVLKNGDELQGIGNVIVTTDTVTILTHRMHWSRSDHLITGDTTVTTVTEYDTVYGTGFVATDDLKKRRILNPTGISTRTIQRSEESETGGEVNPLGRAARVDTSKNIVATGISPFQTDSTTVDSASVSPDSTLSDSLQDDTSQVSDAGEASP